MRKYIFLVILFGIIVGLQFFSCLNNDNVVIINEVGQVEFEKIQRSCNQENLKSCSKKIIHLSSINIIEKYLTIYMILFILSFYVRNRCIIK